MGLIQAFRKVGYAEGVSFLLLLGVAMPLKYVWGEPALVKYLGWAHGVLFVLYMVLLLRVYQVLGWPLKKLVIGFAAAFIPFGPFLLERSLFGRNAASGGK